MKTKKKSGGIVAGLLLLVIGVIMLWWNEGRTVKTQAAINEFQGSYIEIDSTDINSKNEGLAVFTKGDFTFDETGSTDSEFNINVKSAVLYRYVEMYQWKEDCNTDSDGYETCTYEKEWSNDLIDSSDYDDSHKNPSDMPYQSKRFYADNIKLGSFGISEFHNALSTEVDYTDLNEKVATSHSMRIEAGKYTTQAEGQEAKVGDVRITFTYNNATEASVIGQQNGNEIGYYKSSNGYTVGRIDEVITTATDLIQQEIDANNLLKWILRAVGTLLVIFGLLAIISPLQRLASYVPVLGGLVNSLTSALAFGLGLCISFVVIAIAWFRFRPILSIGLIVAGVAIVFLMKKVKSKKQVN